IANVDTELMSLRQDETLVHNLISGAYQGTASIIAERVAQERSHYGWLQLPSDAADEPAVKTSELLEWLSIRRTYTDEQIARAKSYILDRQILPSPEVFANAVTAD